MEVVNLATGGCIGVGYFNGQRVPELKLLKIAVEGQCKPRWNQGHRATVQERLQRRREQEPDCVWVERRGRRVVSSDIRIF